MHRWANKKDMAGDDPPYLSVGTEVSAKYKGAFCEAKIRKVVKAVKCKVQYKNESGSVFVNDEQIKGMLMPGASVEVKQPDKKEYIEGTIIKIQDLSQYTVVFDDGDIATLRRTALCLKSGRHFAESETLDQLPLTHPEHFSTPVVSGIRGSRRRDEMEENSDEESKQERKVEREEDMGKVVCVEVGDKKKSKDNWFPGLIVAPNAQDSVKIDVEDEYLVRSFKDGRYYTVPKRETVEFTREVGARVDHPTLKMAVEKAISFLDKDDLPPHWDREVLFGITDFTSESDGSDTDSTDDEPREEKDHFVAQLYKFMDDRGTPINKGPMISSKDVDLYKLFKIVNKLGGYNRVTNRNQWKSVAVKLGYNANQTNNVKSSYKKYLHNFEDFYRKLGCTMLSHGANKLRSRSHRPLIRDRDKTLPEKMAEKDENSNGDESLEVKEPNGIKAKIESQIKEEVESDDKQKECKKDNPKLKKELSTESAKEDEKTKKSNAKIESPILEDSNQLGIGNSKDNKIKNPKEETKEEKPVCEKKSERKVVKMVPKAENNENKKTEKSTIKTKTAKLKGVEKRIKKNENGLPMRNKRSLKERMKAIVKKFKLKGVSNNEQDKKKQKSSEESNKSSPQLYKLKTKEEILSNGTKTRKLSVGSNENKNVNPVGNGADKKSTTNSSSTGGFTDGPPGSSGTVVKVKKSDEETDGTKKKTYTRKKKDEDKYSSSSSDNLMNQSIDIVSPYKTICIGDKLRVYYGPTHESKVTYEAKVMNKRYGPVTEYFVHYTGWNTRYDEWIRRSRIAEDLSWTPSRDRSRQQNDSPSAGQSPSQTEHSPNQNGGKITAEKVKRSSISPVGKNRSKSVTKSSRQMKNVRSKSPTKCDSKKKSASKDSDENSSAESENESNQTQELQKTRSRTEKQKQQDEDSLSKDGKDTEKKKPPPLKRTRSGSLKLESKEQPVKKRKVTPTKTKTGRTIRNSIMKTLVPRKRMAEKGKKVLKKKESTDKESDEFVTNNEKNIKEVAEDEIEIKNGIKSSKEKETVGVGDVKLENEELEKLQCEEAELVLKIKPFPVTGAVVEEIEASIINKEIKEAKDEDSSPPPLKKETLSDDDAVPTNQFLTDSYLTENLDKPKVTKAKVKKEDEKSPKMFSRSAEKKSNCDIKEKTFFTSRIDKMETKKVDANDKDKKETKIRTLSTFNSYLNMDKIDVIKKVNHLEKTPEKNTDKAGEDDIYEFKEPEPFEFRGIDDRTILHRRSTTRMFDDSPYKRQKISSSPSSDLKEDELPKSAEEVEIKRDSIETETKEKEEKDVAKEIITTKIKPQDTNNFKDELRVEITKEPIVIETQDENTNKDFGKSENTIESSLYSLQNEEEEEEEEDADESKLIISESEQLADSISLTESITNKILGNKVNEISVAFRTFDEDEKNLDVERENADAKTVIKSSNQPAKNDEITDESKKNCAELESSSKDDELESDDESILSTKSSSCSVEKDTIKEESDSIADEKDDYSSDESHSADNDTLLKNKNTRVEGADSKKILKRDSDDRCDDKVKIDENFEDAEDNSESGETVIEHSMIDEVEVEVFTAKKDGGAEQADSKIVEEKKREWENDKPDDEDFAKSREEDDNDGLLLCEETIPKSPESKDLNNDDVFPSGSGMSNKKTEKNKVKKDPRPSAFPTPTIFENTPPTTPEDSTPENSPSDERSGFSSTTFSLNEKTCPNKDSSENDTYSDNSEKSMKMKKYRDENDAYNKKSPYEFDSYLKRKIEEETFFKGDEPNKKKNKSYAPTSTNESEKDYYSDEANSPKPSSLSQKFTKSSYYLELDPDLDANQRIEILEQKLQELRKAYSALKQELSSIDKRRKKLRRREREGRMMTRNEANSLL